MSFTPEELLSKIEEDDKNKIDLTPLISELEYITTTEDVAGTFDKILWDEPSGQRHLKLTEPSRKKLIKDFRGNDTFFLNVCDNTMRFTNMNYIFNLYNENHHKLTIRCRDMSHGIKVLDEDLIVRVVCSENYIKFDNREFVGAMLDPMEEHNMEIMTIDLQENSLKVQAFFDKTNSIVHDKWIYRPGIMIINSETNSYKPAVECVLTNTTDPALIRWPIQGESLLTIDKSKMQTASLSQMAEQVPGSAYEQIEHMEKRIGEYGNEDFVGDYTLQLFLMLNSANINNIDKYITELTHHLARYTNSGKRKVTKLDMVQAVAACANTHSSIRLANLAGSMLSQDAGWDSTLTKLIKGDVEDKVPEEEAIV